VGAGLAREDVGTYSIDVAEKPLSRAIFVIGDKKIWPVS